MTPDLDPPATFTARGPEDLLAVVPVVLGFVPTDSVVMLTFGAARPFHARVDLPPRHAPPEEVSEVVDCLREPALRHGVRRVVFVLYGDDPLPAERMSGRLLRAFREEGLYVIDVLRADGRRWYPLLHGRRAAARGVPYDLAGHPFTAQAVLDGRVTHASRGELADSLATDVERVRRVAAAEVGEADPPCWVRQTTRWLAASGEVADDEVAARLLEAVDVDAATRAAAWGGVPRADAPGHVALWTDLLRRAPDRLAASAAAVLGVLAWRAGHGALAWCAVDRAQALEPDHQLAGLVADLLVHAVPPEDWPDSWEDEWRELSMGDPA